LASPLTVSVAYLGTAINGTDYEPMDAAVTFPPGVNAVKLVILPRPDDVLENHEKVQLGILPSSHYQLGTSTAVVTILNVSP
jgi:hypothetical protein